MFIEPGFESPTCGSYVNFGSAIFGCDFGFMDYVFSEAFISNWAIGQLHESVMVGGLFKTKLFYYVKQLG